jgi:hypothetical protein
MCRLVITLTDTPNPKRAMLAAASVAATDGGARLRLTRARKVRKHGNLDLANLRASSARKDSECAYPGRIQPQMHNGTWRMHWCATMPKFSLPSGFFKMTAC